MQKWKLFFAVACLAVGLAELLRTRMFDGAGPWLFGLPGLWLLVSVIAVAAATHPAPVGRLKMTEDEPLRIQGSLGARVKWIGRPIPERVAEDAELGIGSFAAIMSLHLVGWAVAATTGAAAALNRGQWPDLLSTSVLMLMLAPCGLLVAAPPLLARSRAFRTRYALTDRGAVILVRDRAIDFLSNEDIGEPRLVRLPGDRCHDLILRVPDWNVEYASSAFGFRAIHDAEELPSLGFSLGPPEGAGLVALSQGRFSSG